MTRHLLHGPSATVSRLRDNRWARHRPHRAAARHWRQFPPKVTPPNAGASGAEEYGRTRAWNLCCSPSKLSILLAKTTVARPHRARQNSLVTGVDFVGSGSIYTHSFRHAAASARRRVFEAPSRI